MLHAGRWVLTILNADPPLKPDAPENGKDAVVAVQAPADDWLQDFFFVVEDMMESQEPFGALGACKSRSPWTGNKNIRDQDTCWIRFDGALDD